jgi:hypothetical protein
MILAAGKRMDKSFGFLKSSCRQKFINQCRKPDVPAQRIRFEQPEHEAMKKSLLFGCFVVNSIP